MQPAKCVSDSPLQTEAPVPLDGVKIPAEPILLTSPTTPEYVDVPSPRQGEARP